MVCPAVVPLKITVEMSVTRNSLNGPTAANQNVSYARGQGRIGGNRNVSENIYRRVKSWWKAVAPALVPLPTVRSLLT